MTRLQLWRRLFALGIPLFGVTLLIATDPPSPNQKGSQTIEATTSKPAETGTTSSPKPPTKAIVELPTKTVVASSNTITSTQENPRVTAGLVKWHPTLEAAQAAAKKSGKPVLLFQMMGHLDKKFC
jgi:hypothetical protein